MLAPPFIRQHSIYITWICYMVYEFYPRFGKKTLTGSVGMPKIGNRWVMKSDDWLYYMNCTREFTFQQEKELLDLKEQDSLDCTSQHEQELLDITYLFEFIMPVLSYNKIISLFKYCLGSKVHDHQRNKINRLTAGMYTSYMRF